MKVKGNAGEHLTVLPPYGYMKSSDDKKQWVKDEEAAQVVYENWSLYHGMVWDPRRLQEN